MARIWKGQTSFNAGALDPRLKSRYDLELYFQGASQASNCTSIPHGGMTRRDGWAYRATLPGMPRLIAFQFNVEQVYTVAISNTRIDIYGSDGTLKDSITSSVPFLTADLYDIDYAQSADTMILAHENRETQLLVRVDDTTWTLTAATFVAVPQFDFADASSPTPTSEIQQITFDGDALNGDTYKLELEGLETDTLTYSSTASENVSRIADALQDLANTGDSGISVVSVSDFIYNITLSGSSANTWELLSGRWITTASAGAVLITVTRTQAGTARAEDVWSATRGWPRSVTFHEGRLVFGGSFSRPATLWLSRTFRYFDFNVAKGRDDDAIDYTLDTGQVNVIQSVVSGRALQVFTSEAEFYAKNTPLTPESMNLTKQTGFGSKKIKPVVQDGGTVFIQRLGSAIREFLFVDVEQAYSSDSINIRAPHLFNDPVQMESATGNSNEDANYIYVVNSDGTMAVFNTLRSEKIAAWTPWATRAGDKVKSVCVLDNVLWLAVEREVNGATVYYLEEATPTARLDCSVVGTQASSATVTGLAHLNTEECRARAGNVIYPNVTPSGGSVTLSEAVTDYEIGLNWVPVLATMPVVVTDRGGQSVAATRKRLVGTSLDLVASAGVIVQNQRIPTRGTGVSLLDQGAPEHTGRVDVSHGGWYRDDMVVTITQTDPLPLTLIGLELEVLV